MAKGIVLCFIDADPGADDNNVTVRAEVLFVGATVPNTPLLDRGPEGNGVPIPLNIGNLTTNVYGNAVEDALLLRATQLGFTLARGDCLFPGYTKGS